jgi:hypothetical protein
MYIGIRTEVAECKFRNMHVTLGIYIYIQVNSAHRANKSNVQLNNIRLSCNLSALKCIGCKYYSVCTKENKVLGHKKT